VRWDNYQDTPYPIETPAGQNPPDGAIIDYFLKTAAVSELTLTVYDEQGAEIVTFSSEVKPTSFLPANVPSYWFTAPEALSKGLGVNRFVWNLSYPPPPSLSYGYYGKLLEYTEYTLADHAVPGLTPRQQPRGPLVVPGEYLVELRYQGYSLRRALTVELDPRVHASKADLVVQRDLALEASRGMKSSYEGYQQIASLRKLLEERRESLKNSGSKEIKDGVESLEKKIDAIELGTKTAPGFGPVNRDLARLLFSVESADMRPAETVRSAIQQSCDALDRDLIRWQQLNTQDLASLNAVLAESKVPALPVVLGNDSAGCKP